jgi:putative endonuclease
LAEFENAVSPVESVLVVRPTSRRGHGECPERGIEATESKDPTSDSQDRVERACARLDDDGIVVPACFVYILRCSDGTLYTGWTTDLAERQRAHNEGRGAKYTAGRRPVTIEHSERHESRSAAQNRESQLKGWTRAKKEALIVGDLDRLHGLSKRPTSRAT